MDTTPTLTLADNRSVCGCFGGPEFFRYVAIDERARCTNCNGLARQQPAAVVLEPAAAA